MADLSTVISNVATILAALSGIRAAPVDPPEQINVYPFAVVYPGDGEASFDASSRLNLDTIVVELHVARKDLPRDVALSLPYVDSIPNALMQGMRTSKWSASIETFESITWTFGPLGWGGMETLGFRFSVNGVKRHIDFT